LSQSTLRPRLVRETNIRLNQTLFTHVQTKTRLVRIPKVTTPRNQVMFVNNKTTDWVTVSSLAGTIWSSLWEDLFGFLLTFKTGQSSSCLSSYTSQAKDPELSIEKQMAWIWSSQVVWQHLNVWPPEVSQISSTAGGAAELLTDNGGKICRWEHHMGKEPFMLETKELIL